MGIKPLGDRVLIRPHKAEGRSKGGILLVNPDKPNEGVVIAVGPGARNEQGERIPMEVSVGDRVIYGKYAGGAATVQLEGKDHYLLREGELLGIIT